RKPGSLLLAHRLEDYGRRIEIEGCSIEGLGKSPGHTGTITGCHFSGSIEIEIKAKGDRNETTWKVLFAFSKFRLSKGTLKDGEVISIRSLKDLGGPEGRPFTHTHLRQMLDALSSFFNTKASVVICHRHPTEPFLSDRGKNEMTFKTEVRLLQ